MYINDVSLLPKLKCPKESKYLRSTTVILNKPDLDFSQNCWKKFCALSLSLRLPRRSQRNLLKHKERREVSFVIMSQHLLASKRGTNIQTCTLIAQIEDSKRMKKVVVKVTLDIDKQIGIWEIITRPKLQLDPRKINYTHKHIPNKG